MAALTLYHSAMSLCAAKVRIVLAEKQIDWASVLLNLRAGDSRKPEYLQLNPNALVPTIVQDQRPLIKSTVICEYLDDGWPKSLSQTGACVGSCQDPRLWTKQLDEGVHSAVSTLSFCLAIRHEFLAHPPSEKVKWLSGNSAG